MNGQRGREGDRLFSLRGWGRGDTSGAQDRSCRPTALPAPLPGRPAFTIRLPLPSCLPSAVHLPPRMAEKVTPLPAI